MFCHGTEPGENSPDLLRHGRPAAPTVLGEVCFAARTKKILKIPLVRERKWTLLCKLDPWLGGCAMTALEDLGVLLQEVDRISLTDSPSRKREDAPVTDGAYEGVELGGAVAVEPREGALHEGEHHIRQEFFGVAGNEEVSTSMTGHRIDAAVGP